MTPEEFEKMTKTEQVNHLFKAGTKLLFRHNSGYEISLYQVSGFYAEVWYRSGENNIEKIKVISPAQVLNKYDTEIQIDDLN